MRLTEMLLQLQLDWAKVKNKGKIKSKPVTQSTTFLDQMSRMKRCELHE